MPAKKKFASKLQDTNLDTELRLGQQGFSACFVSKEQYQQLMFVLSQTCTTTENHQMYEEILTLLNDFHTSSKEDFQAMVKQLEIPFKYQHEISLEENRQHFKEFFLF